MTGHDSAPLREIPGVARERHALVVAELRHYRAWLAEEMRWVNDAIRAMEGHRRRPRPRAGKSGTYMLLRRHITVADPPYTAAGALAWIEASGQWASGTSDRLGAVATALAHLAKWGELDRIVGADGTGRGRYQRGPRFQPVRGDGRDA